MWNRAFFQMIRIGDGAIADCTYEEPFASLLGSHKGSIVEVKGCYSNQRIQSAIRDLCNRLSSR
jgi:hypothetical protein